MADAAGVKVTPAQLRALDVLARLAPGYTKAIPSRWFAEEYWKDSLSWKRSSRQGVGGQFMPALGARLLYRMAKVGLVHFWTTEHAQARFYISKLGSEVLALRKQELTTELTA